MIGGELLVLMVAEKPSIAAALTEALCPQRSGASKRRATSPSSPVHEYSGTFLRQPARFRVTATTGHVYSLDFSQEYNNWETHNPDALFSATTVRTYDGRANMPAHIAAEAKDCDILVLWLDCDREGENICFEVLELALPHMRPAPVGAFPDAYRGCVYRARFSSLAPQDLQAAMMQLAQPNRDEALSVDARQELDLRVGVAFSRLQTMYFRKHFGRQLGKQMVTYGPCQIPTLWFCVHRHVAIVDFVPEPYWQLTATVSAGHGSFQAQCDQGRIWNEAEAQALLGSVEATTGSRSPTSLRCWSSVSRRPKPLNTVEMLKTASEVLGLGPDDALHVAESLYLKGVLSYPRTETDRYPENFDLHQTVQTLAVAQQLPWSEAAGGLLRTGIAAPREDGHDVGDHPPITPVKAATQSQCGSEAGWALYELVCRHFLASVSPDAALQEAEVAFVLGPARFVAVSRRVRDPGWTRVAQVRLQEIGEIDLSTGFREGDAVTVQRTVLSRHLTAPPKHLTESELLALMDQHGIGTDASMASHVGNVQKRKYVQLNEATREMIPSELGLALCHAYMLIDPELVLPTVRASIENACARVARGEARKEAVVQQSLRTFLGKFYGFARQIDRVPLMLAVAHSLSRSAGGGPQGGAAGESLRLWREAASRTGQTSLEALLRHRDEAMVSNSATAGAFNIDEIMVDSPAVRHVQEALEELGFVATEAPARQRRVELRPRDGAQEGGGGGRGGEKGGKNGGRRKRGGKGGKGGGGNGGGGGGYPPWAGAAPWADPWAGQWQGQQQQIFDQGGIPNVVAAMAKFRRDGDVQLGGAMALGGLCVASDACAISAAKYGGINVMTAALERHAKRPDVLIAVSETLALIASTRKEEILQRMAPALPPLRSLLAQHADAGTRESEVVLRSLRKLEDQLLGSAKEKPTLTDDDDWSEVGTPRQNAQKSVVKAAQDEAKQAADLTDRFKRWNDRRKG